MFEKEAEKYWYDSGSNEFDIGEVEKASKQSFIDGATFGYNKANEWHYPSKGEYPKEGENVWCYCKGIGIKFCCAGHTVIGGDNKVRWWEENKAERLFVIAWREIVLPEIKE